MKAFDRKKAPSAGLFCAMMVVSRLARNGVMIMDAMEYLRESQKIERQRSFAKKQTNGVVREKVMALLDRQQAELDAVFAKQEELPLGKTK